MISKNAVKMVGGRQKEAYPSPWDAEKNGSVRDGEGR